MAILSGASDFFGLDIGTTSIRAVQLTGGSQKSLGQYGQADISALVPESDAEIDHQRLAQLIKQMLKDAKISSSHVAMNLPSNRVFTTIVEMDKLNPADLAKAIRYQADSYIPTPLAQSTIDFSVLGPSSHNTTKIEVLLTSSPNAFIETRISMLESIGLSVIAVEPDAIALMRSLLPSDDMGVQMVMDMGASITDQVIVANGYPRVTRAIATGTRAVVNGCMQALAVDKNQAQQFVFKFGLGRDKLEGKVYNAIMPVIEALMGEVEKSIKFFNERYPNLKIEKLVVTGGASAIPELPLYMANRFGLNVEIGNAWRNISAPAERQNELAAVANHFAVAAGLAERNA